MGVYDTIGYLCPTCGEQATVQTKAFNCEMECFGVGSTIRDSPPNLRLLMKVGCRNGHQAVLVIENHKFIGVEQPITKRNYDMIEEAFGEFISV